MDQSYDISKASLKWMHPVFTVDTKPIEHALCGTVAYELKFRD